MLLYSYKNLPISVLDISYWLTLIDFSELSFLTEFIFFSILIFVFSFGGCGIKFSSDEEEVKIFLYTFLLVLVSTSEFKSLVNSAVCAFERALE